MTGFEIDPQRLLLEGMESGEFPDLKPLALAREYALESAQGNPGENEIVRWWHSPEGFYYEFKRFPAAFYGRLGLVQGEYLTTHQAQELVWEALARAEKDQADLTLFYTANLMQSNQDFFMAYTLGHTRIERGEARYALPLFMRLQTPQHLLVLFRLKDEYLAFKVPKGQPVLQGLFA
ncbi:MAG: hypothetical protein KatS3mg074_627 [Meiothermus sp.]|uniref:Uncharacterized protein n=2 Tax=Meiothermus hypogaeus TaxID=884155 RepID=A0A511R4G8_9DEIN|nr:hypothetical protein [Meiothermus hypogaeus]RIH78640.1 hypothetical protein Mhypo_01489 [Meiothermus hypogaeus]GEM84501.1 hypothetical protein MHY01S_26670 [Meiothermus hypogaeus NBRC 106114]GIW38229.1 MAG: hypothetical protein KatS3mg074_627 [Meiothermus sp.]